jgi:ABC-type Fe3+/spermidine/putrescine transport system ATPase subunit
MRIKLENVFKEYNNATVVKNVSLNVKDGEIMALLGPSGCGKTTILRMLAGLVPMSSGKILFDDKDVSEFSSQKRNTAMVFQNYALFPHLNVEENISFGLKVRKLSKSEIRQRLSQIIKSVELEGLEKRKIHELSGGQRQRVALARALVIRPDILLFDEPLSNLDEKLRVTMRQSIKKLQREFGITSVYVTHDQEEAMSIADHITVMNNGEIQQCATPNEIYKRPKNAFVANFVGQANLFKCSQYCKDKKNYISILNKNVILNDKNIEKDEMLMAMLRPEHLYFDKSGIEGIVDFKEELGLITRYQIKINSIVVTIDELNTKTHQNINIGEKIKISFNENDVVIL